MQLIPQSNPQQSYLEHGTEIRAAIERVLSSGRYILGPEVELFETEFASWLGAAGAVGVGNGTDALSIALMAVGVARGDIVISVSHTAVATIAAIEAVGAIPMLVDIDPETYTIDVVQVEQAITTLGKSNERRIGAVVPVHLYGHPAPMPALRTLCDHYDIPLVEDCAQAHGAIVNNHPVGTIGKAAAFSFYPTKNLGAIGDGGGISSSDHQTLERCRALREYGWKQRFVSEFSGKNSRLDELQAAILRVKLPHLERNTQRRIEIAKRYDNALADTGLLAPRTSDGARHVYHQYVIRCKHRDSLRTWLFENGIHTAIHYPLPVHRQPAYRKNNAVICGNLQNTETLCDEILSLPMYPEMNDGQVSRVCESLTNWSNDG